MQSGVRKLPSIIESHDILRGTRGTYEIEKEVGSGGMAEVYLGRHTDSNWPVAIKVAKAAAHDNFIEREYNALASVKHENVVSVYDGGFVDGRKFIVMEYLEGKDLYTYIHAAMVDRPDAPVEPDAAVAITLQVLAALEAVHKAQLVHADVKPTNVFLAESQDSTKVKILDFGLSSTFSECAKSSAIFGTPGFMAPEQAAGRPFSPKSDIYAVGVLLYTMLTGQEPFSGSDSQIVEQTISSYPPPLEAKCDDLPAELVDTVNKAMEKDPEKRFRDATEFREQLERILFALDSS